MSKPISKGKTGFNAILFVVASIGALGAVNVLSTRHFKRLDMTEQGSYTLAKASKDLVKNLPDRMNVKLFMSEDLKPPFKGHAQFVRDLLQEYATYSDGKFNVEVIKIGEGEEARKKEEEAAKFGVQKTQRGVLSSSKMEIGSTYLGIGFGYKDKTEAIPVIDRDEGLEFLITSLIKQMTVKKKKVGFTSGQGEPTAQHGGGIAYLSEQLKASGYETTNVELKAKVPDDVDALLVVGPKQPFSERAKYVLDQYLMRGKAIGFFVDGQSMTTPRGQMAPGMEMPQISQANDVQLDDLLGAYGLKIRQDILLDAQNFPGLVTVGMQRAPANHPVFVAAGPLPQSHPIQEHVRALFLAYPSSVELVGDTKSGKGPVQFVKLGETSANSWRPSGPFVFIPTQRMTIGEDKGPFVLGYVGQGKFKSAFAGKQIVKEDGTKVDGNISQPGIEPMLTEGKDSSRLVVLGDADLINDQFLEGEMRLGLRQVAEQNMGFLINAIDWLAQDDTLTAVRSKGMQSRPLDQAKLSSEGKISLLKAANIILLPLFLLLIGLVRWRLRNSARASAKL